MSTAIATTAQSLAAAVKTYLEARDALTEAEAHEDRVLDDYLINAGQSQAAEQQRTAAAQAEFLALARLRAALRDWENA